MNYIKRLLIGSGWLMFGYMYNISEVKKISLFL